MTSCYRQKRFFLDLLFGGRIREYFRIYGGILSVHVQSLYMFIPSRHLHVQS